MKNNKKIIALTLSAAFILTACTAAAINENTRGYGYGRSGEKQMNSERLSAANDNASNGYYERERFEDWFEDRYDDDIPFSSLDEVNEALAILKENYDNRIISGKDYLDFLSDLLEKAGRNSEYYDVIYNVFTQVRENCQYEQSSNYYDDAYYDDDDYYDDYDDRHDYYDYESDRFEDWFENVYDDDIPFSSMDEVNEALSVLEENYNSGVLNTEDYIDLLYELFEKTRGNNEYYTAVKNVLTEIKSSYRNSIGVFVDGQNVRFEQFDNVRPENQNGRIFVPVRAVVEALKAEVTYNAADRTVVIKKDNTTVTMTIGSDIAYVNGTETKLDNAVYTYDDRTMVPLRFISEALDFNVNWENDTQTVIINDTSN